MQLSCGGGLDTLKDANYILPKTQHISTHLGTSQLYPWNAMSQQSESMILLRKMSSVRFFNVSSYYSFVIDLLLICYSFRIRWIRLASLTKETNQHCFEVGACAKRATSLLGAGLGRWKVV